MKSENIITTVTTYHGVGGGWDWFKGARRVGHMSFNNRLLGLLLLLKVEQGGGLHNLVADIAGQCLAVDSLM